jgi:dihydrofolate reductase
MNKVYTGASMSLDGFVAGPNETGFEYLFAWYGNGEIAVPTANPAITLQLTEANARHQQRLLDQTGAIVVGRKLYDATNAWGGQHPMGVPVVVLTHHPPEPREGFHFVTTSIEDAVAMAAELAGDKVVGVNAGTIATQSYAAGLLDEVWIGLVPVILGAGRPFFDGLGGPVTLDGPLEIAEGTGVTHLRYAVPRPA